MSIPEEITKTYEFLDDEYTSLHYAAEQGKLEVVKELVENRGVAIDIRSGKKSKTPLQFAAAEKHPEVVAYLLAHGASVEAQDSYQANCATLMQLWVVMRL